MSGISARIDKPMEQNRVQKQTHEYMCLEVALQNNREFVVKCLMNHLTSVRYSDGDKTKPDLSSYLTPYTEINS